MNENDLMLAIHALFEVIEKDRDFDAEASHELLSDLIDYVLVERQVNECEIRNKALSELDMNWATKEYPEANDEELLVYLHKDRVECKDLSDQLRLESVEWLRERGLCRIYGQNLPPPGELPK